MDLLWKFHPDPFASVAGVAIANLQLHHAISQKRCKPTPMLL